MSEDEEPLVNLTPLIDVVFVILIAFILVAPLIQAEKVKLARGKETEGIFEKTPIVISVLPGPVFMLNKQALSLHDLKQALLVERQKFPDAEPLLFQDKESTFGSYHEVKRLVEEAGFQNLNVVLEGS